MNTQILSHVAVSSTHIEVNLSKIGNNLSQIRKLISPDVKIMALVKANAYGHGIVEVAQYLQSCNIDMFGVAFVHEAVILRDAGITKPILVLYGATVDEFPLFTKHDLEITVSSRENAVVLNDYLNSIGASINVHLKTDTGMGRIGVQYDTAASVAEQITYLPHLNLTGIYSHFATSEGDDPEFVELQLERFQAVLTDLGKRGIEIEHVHIANSGAIINTPESHFTMVRPGITLYGYPPTENISNTISLQPALSLRSRIGYVKEVGQGVSISYGRTYTTTRATRIGTIPIGYGDGYSRLLSNKANVLIHGKRYPVAGIVCMDQIMVDLGSESTISIGDEVTLIGKNGDNAISAWELAHLTGTIPYEILCALSSRIPRTYTNEI